MTINSKSKVAAMAAGLAIAASMLAVAPIASAASLTSAQVSSILTMISAFGADSATIANVNAALTGTAVTSGSTVTSTGGTSACTFSSNLTIGSTGMAVTCLQNALIAGGFSIPAGATGYFGTQTKTAVASWQSSKNISPAAGYFGAISRAAFNLGGSTSTNTTTTTTTTTTSTAGCTAGAAFSSTTGAACAVTTTNNGVEGSFTLTQAPAPANNTNVTTNTNTPVFGMQVKATGSAITIDRQDLQIAVTYTGGTLNPAGFISSISAYDGSTLLKTMPLSSADFTKDSTVYYVRMIGIGFNVPAGTTKTLTFKINTSALGSADNARTLTVTGYGIQGTRGVDGAGLSSYTDADWTSTFAFNASNNSTLTASASSDTPLAQTIAVNTTDGVQGVVMQKVDLKSTIGDSTLTDLRVVVETNGDSTSVPTALFLYNGTPSDANLLGSAAVATSTGNYSYGNVNFTNLSLDIAKNATKTLTVTANFPATAVGIASTTIGVTSASSLYETSDGTSNNIVVSSAITGNDVHLMAADATTYTLVSSSVTSERSQLASQPSSVTGTIVLNAKSVGGALTKPTAGMFDVWFASSTPAKTTNGGTGYAAATGSINVTPTIQVTPTASTLTDGTYTITITGTLYSTNASFVQTAGVGFSEYMAIDSIDTTMDPTGGSVSNQMWGMDTFFTPSASLVENS